MTSKNETFSTQTILDGMTVAQALAEEAAKNGDVPVGSTVIHPKHGIVGTGMNRKERSCTGTRHAEMEALEDACDRLGRWRLDDCVLISTLEPCIMCAGALIQCRIGGVIYGARDAKFGALGSLYQVHQDSRHNHRFVVTEGLRAETAQRTITNFFRKKRGLHPLKD